MISLLENRTGLPYDCLMLKLEVPDWEELISNIDEDDVYTDGTEYGKEHEPHVTILYGLLPNTLDTYKDSITDILDEFGWIDVMSVGISCFEKDEYDVLKFDIQLTDQLLDLNKEILKLPNENEYPEYKPHCTIAYVKKGCGQKYHDLEYFIGTESNKYLYSEADGSRWTYETSE